MGAMALNLEYELDYLLDRELIFFLTYNKNPKKNNRLIDLDDETMIDPKVMDDWKMITIQVGSR